MRRRIEVDVWKGGYPVWCHLKIDGVEVASFHHEELADVAYELKRAMRDARVELGDRHKDEV